MTRLLHLAASAALLFALAVAVSGDRQADPDGSATWGSSLVLQDPDPGFWRTHPGGASEAARVYSAGMSSLAATTRIAVAPGDALELTNLGASGAILLESGALVLTNAEGSLALQRGGEVPGLEPAPIGIGTMLLRGDRITFSSTTTVAFRNPEATAASLLLTTEIPERPAVLAERPLTDSGARCPGPGEWGGLIRLSK